MPGLDLLSAKYNYNFLGMHYQYTDYSPRCPYNDLCVASVNLEMGELVATATPHFIQGNK